MADKPTVIIKVSGKKTGKNDKLSIDEKGWSVAPHAIPPGVLEFSMRMGSLLP